MNDGLDSSGAATCWADFGWPLPRIAPGCSARSAVLGWQLVCESRHDVRRRWGSPTYSYCTFVIFMSVIQGWTCIVLHSNCHVSPCIVRFCIVTHCSFLHCILFCMYNCFCNCLCNENCIVFVYFSCICICILHLRLHLYLYLYSICICIALYMPCPGNIQKLVPIPKLVLGSGSRRVIRTQVLFRCCPWRLWGPKRPV